MPFLQEGSVGAEFVGGPVGYGLPAAELIVDLDKIVELQHGFENELVRIRKWLNENDVRFSIVGPPGGDPCSQDTVCAFGENGDAAIEAMRGYVAQLESVAFALDKIANAYGLTENANAHTLGHETT